MFVILNWNLPLGSFSRCNWISASFWPPQRTEKGLWQHPKAHLHHCWPRVVQDICFHLLCLAAILFFHVSDVILSLMSPHYMFSNLLLLHRQNSINVVMYRNCANANFSAKTAEMKPPIVVMVRFARINKKDGMCTYQQIWSVTVPFDLSHLTFVIQ